MGPCIVEDERGCVMRAMVVSMSFPKGDIAGGSTKAMHDRFNYLTAWYRSTRPLQSFCHLVHIAKTKVIDRTYVDQPKHARFISHFVRYHNSNPSTYPDHLTPNPHTSKRK